MEDGIMKKSLFFAAALLALASCAREVAVDVPGGDITLVARTEGPATKTIVEGETHVWWEPGDAIKVFVGEESAEFTTDITAAAATASFHGTLEVPDGADLWAVYPFTESAAFADGTVTTVLPAAQVARAGSFEKDLNLAIAHTTGTELLFRNVGGGVKFSVSKAGISQVSFKGNNAEPLAGTVKVGLDENGIPAVAEILEPATEITLSAPAGTTFEAGQWYFIMALPTALPDGYTLTLTYEDNHEEMVKSDKAVEIKRARFGVLTEVDTKVQPSVATFRMTHLWLWGGTGPEYGGTKVFDLLTKPNYFNNDDNRGVTALVDNYYQIGADGSFVNYAGEDGRNWWFVYSGSVNPESGKDLDLRKFYDVLPLSTGQFALDGTTVTLTRADGTTTQATLVGPGTYDMPNTSPLKSVTIETMALMFTIEGGVASWDQNIMYTDYHAIAGNPRVLFVELEQLPADFVVPEASRTTDADFEYDSGEFDWTTLPGKWNVYGGNSKPYGIWVLGGSGGDPDFVSPIEKTWDWDDSIYKESDNGLVIKVTSFSETSAAGTTNWWSGDDGKFWNYIWKFKNDEKPEYEPYYGTDLSQFYDQIPKGEHEFSIDLATMKVTLGNGHVATFLTPGVYTFPNNKTREIPADCFALDFHLMDNPVLPATEFRYKDIDRFMFAPIEYIIIFEKQ
jgi:hypothetical protein